MDEVLRIRKNRIAPEGSDTRKRISIVTGIHGDELEGQFVCYEIARRIEEHRECLHGIVDLYPALNPFGICIVGSMRGNENQQLYACSCLVKKLTQLEADGRIMPGKQILVIPCVNPYSMNIKKRFWTIDNTDINRMFPGYSEGETTQRIAAGVFDAIKDYTFGVQFASFYMPGAFVPHVRMMKTGFEDVSLASQFGLPYVVLHTPRPFDTTTLNYNWQIWETQAFSVYTTNTSRMERTSAHQAVEAILNFMSKQEIIRYRGYNGYISRVIESEDFIPVRTADAGFFESMVQPGEEVEEGQLLVYIPARQSTLHGVLVHTFRRYSARFPVISA